LQRCREIRVREHLAGLRRMTRGKERPSGDAIGGKFSLAALPLTADDFGHRVSVLRIVNRRSDRLRHWYGAELREQLRPSFDHPWDGHREDTGVWNARQLARRECFGSGGVG